MHCMTYKRAIAKQRGGWGVAIQSKQHFILFVYLIFFAL